MRHRGFHEGREIGMRDQRARLVENHDRAMLSRTLRVDEIAEGVELQIGRDDAGYLAAQGRADRNDRRADAEREIGCRNVWPVGAHCLPVPGPLAGVVAILPQIELAHLVALPVLKDPSHWQVARRRGTNQIDDGVGDRRRPQPVALVFAEVICSPHLQPRAVIKAGIDAVRLLHFLQGGLEQRNRAACLRSLVRVGHARTGGEYIHQ